MKKIKKLGIMAVSVALLTTALAVPASATSVSGSVGGYSCSGSNSIYASGASANTHCSGNAALGVTLHYYYDNRATGKIVHVSNQSSNGLVRDFSTNCSKASGNTRSNYCYSIQRVNYYVIWQQQTGIQKY